VRANLHDGAPKLVAERQRREPAGQRVGPVSRDDDGSMTVFLDVRAADAARAYPEEGLTLARGWLGDVHDPDVAAAKPAGGLHAASPIGGGGPGWGSTLSARHSISIIASGSNRPLTSKRLVAG